jgi:hypothetical protein
MSMNNTYLNDIANSGGALITHIGLVNATGTELTGGTYARQPVTWATAATGTVRPNADLSFAIPAGTTVGGWVGYSAVTAGTSYGGQDLTQETFTNSGTFTLLAAGTGVTHSAL